jgi:hypothetical protein
MNFELKPISAIQAYLPSVMEREFKFDSLRSADSMKELDAMFSKFIPGIWVGVESQYVDKLYRDAYYNYYSSKLNSYRRDCIRLSFFDGPVTLEDFQSVAGVQRLQSIYKGFIVIRPTSPKVIGRNVLHPAVFKKEHAHLIASAYFPSSVNGVKLLIEGFPHSSQDSEFMVCAETTIWSVMEYFSNRYSDYEATLPKKIHGLLSATSVERQLPSSGLTGLQISYALKELGFGVKLYSSSPKPEDQEAILDIIRIYVESGIPVVTAISNDKGVAHVLNIVGRTQFVSELLDIPVDTLIKGSRIFNYYSQEAKYLVIDDNLPAYSPISLDDPACNYEHPDWTACKIIAAIVPLHKRIYMEANRAKALAKLSLQNFDGAIKKLPNLALRVLLSSSRSFKHSVSINPDLDVVHKTIINNLNMPKFVWIAEVGTRESFAAGKATGMLLMDATEPKKTEILAYFLENTYIGKINGKITEYTLPLRPFKIHQNLKSF